MGCKEETGYGFKFDFYINNQYCIEYDGDIHFGATHGWNDENHFKNTQKRDELKNQYCFNHNIPLIRIPYTHLKNLTIQDIILETSNFIVKE